MLKLRRAHRFSISTGSVDSFLTLTSVIAHEKGISSKYELEVKVKRSTAVENQYAPMTCGRRGEFTGGWVARSRNINIRVIQQ